MKPSINRLSRTLEGRLRNATWHPNFVCRVGHHQPRVRLQSAELHQWQTVPIYATCLIMRQQWQLYLHGKQCGHLLQQQCRLWRLQRPQLRHKNFDCNSQPPGGSRFGDSSNLSTNDIYDHGWQKVWERQRQHHWQHRSQRRQHLLQQSTGAKKIRLHHQCFCLLYTSPSPRD